MSASENFLIYIFADHGYPEQLKYPTITLMILFRPKPKRIKQVTTTYVKENLQQKEMAQFLTCHKGL